MNEQIQDHFSCADWIVIPASVRNGIVDILSLTAISHNEKWANNPIIYITEYKGVNDYYKARLNNIDKILVTSLINGHYIIEGTGLQYIYQSLCERLSINSYAYYFSIDLWSDYSAYAYYENGKEERFYCVEFDDVGDIYEEDRGSILPCEKNAEFNIPTVEIEGEQAPDAWFLPIGIMYNLGLTDTEILQVFDEHCSIYSFNSNDSKVVKDIFEVKNKLITKKDNS